MAEHVLRGAKNLRARRYDLKPISMKRTEWAMVLLVFAVGLAIHGSNVLYGSLGLSGEGVACVGAQRVLEGQVPYRDFWTVYAPGSYYLLAGLFAVLGSQILVARVAAAVLVSLAGACVYGLMRTRTPRWIALVWSVGVALALFPMGERFGTYPPVVVCIAAALWAASVYFGNRRIVWLIVAGVACSFAITFKHDVGGYTTIAIFVTLLIRRIQSESAEESSRTITLLRESAHFLMGCASVAIVVYAVVWIVAGGDLWRDLVWFPLTDFAASRSEKFPAILPVVKNMTSVVRTIEELSWRTRFAAPAAVFLASVAQLSLSHRRLAPARFATQAMLTVAMPLFWFAAHVQVNTHIYTLTVLSAAIGAIWFADLTDGRSKGSKARACLIAVVLAFGFLPRPAFEVARAYFGDHDVAPLNLDRGRGIACDRGTAISVRNAVNYVREHTEADEVVYVGTIRHDVVVVSPSIVYFLLDRPIAVRYHELHPAIADTDSVQAEMVGDLERQHVRYAILWRRFSDQELDAVQQRRENDLPDTGATRMDEYLDANFEQVESFGRFEIFRRRESAIR